MLASAILRRKPTNMCEECIRLETRLRDLNSKLRGIHIPEDASALETTEKEYLLHVRNSHPDMKAMAASSDA